jgi:two-component system chemotaxis response regulator CheB
MTAIRVAAVLSRAVARQHVREVIDARSDVQLVVVSATASAVRPRLAEGDVDLCLVDADLPDASALLTLGQQCGVQMAVLLWGGEVSATVRQLAVRRSQVHEVRGDGSVADVVAGLLPRRPGGLASRPVARAVDRGVRPAWGTRQDLLVIGSSTGGPDALAVVLGSLPAWFDSPVLICQHMPPSFTELLARSLDKITHLSVGEAGDGTHFGRGQVWIAPGGHHMVVAAPGRLTLNQDPPVNSCRPSVDVLFTSVAEVYGRRAVTVMLTGMGSDGAKGCALLHHAGSRIIAQDEASSVVWGMPGAVVNAGLADEVVPLHRVADAIVAQFARTSPLATEALR